VDIFSLVGSGAGAWLESALTCRDAGRLQQTDLGAMSLMSLAREKHRRPRGGWS
jgi:hypothetical protein